MSRPQSSAFSLFSLFPSRTRCLSCQFRGFQPQLSRRNISSSTPKTPQKGNEQAPGQTSGSRKYASAPEPLNHPLGVAKPPQEGENTGIDTRTIRQRRDDFVDHEKHIARRKELTKQVAKPYFREWSRTGYNKGKTFIANQRLFKADKALYFPNLYGRTLLAEQQPLRDTTPVLRGRISVVSVFSSLWAEKQVASFIGLKENAVLHQLLKESGGIAQKIDINAEDNILKEWLIRMFMWSMRRKIPKEQHGRYFLVRKGFTENLKERIGIMNSKVGYVYLLDEKCKIRWAGNSIAAETERESLNNGLRKLITEKKTALDAAPKKRILTETANGVGNKEAIPA